MQKKITVHIRIRDTPDAGELWQVKENILYQRLDSTTHLTYSCYQNVFHKVKTKDIYHTCIKEMIDEVLTGKNCTIFAYGQTGSGKTHTMLGTLNEPGIIKLALEAILKGNISVSISYLEIYNENIIDLINTDNIVKIYSVSNNTQTSGVTTKVIHNLDEAFDIIKTCEKKRKTGQTEYNVRSSRSHTIFQIYIEHENIKSTLSLIDLAGSERASGSLERRKEGSYINKSLLALGSVVNKLIKNEYVNYRDSKLTRILQQSLDGNSNVVSLCMLSPDDNCLLESISTLKFAARLSKIDLKDKQTRMVTLKAEKTACGQCKCCIGYFGKSNIEIITKKDDKPNEKEDLQNDENLDTVKELQNDIAEQNHQILLVKAENDLYAERIRNLEDTVKSLMTQIPSKRINDLFELEKNMFHLQLEIIKRKK